jgi:1,4-alpha-glucan branching enzyme
VRDALYPPAGFSASWRADQCLENHDIVRWDYENNQPRAPRVPALADPSNHRSWYAQSRSHVATTLLLAAPGIPSLFMGQEFLEDKPWHDDVRNWSRFLIWWDGLRQPEPAMRDFLRFTTDLVRLAVAEANRRYNELAKDVELAGFVLYDGARVAAECQRRMR